MVDFSELPTRKKTYAGANGGKIAVIYNGEQYMLKFPPHAGHNENMSYSNSCISEYLGSHIFNIAEIPAQETFLGTYRREKVVVACKDFTSYETVLQDFASLKNTLIDSGHSGYGTELCEIIEVIEEQNSVDPAELKKHFWDMFILDALIGNWDRHNGNWGFLYNNRTDEVAIAPVYDCGSSLYPQADEKIMEMTLSDQSEMDFRIYEIPTSAIRMNGQKIRYYDFISSLQNEECNDALLRTVDRIDMSKIAELVNSTPYISELHKLFCITMLTKRKEIILDGPAEALRRRK